MEAEKFGDEGIRILFYIMIVIFKDAPQKFILSVMNGF